MSRGGACNTVLLTVLRLHKQGFLYYTGVCFPVHKITATIQFCYIIAGDRMWTAYHYALVSACSQNTVPYGGFGRLLQQLPPEMLYLFALLFHFRPQERHLVLMASTLHALFLCDGFVVKTPHVSICCLLLMQSLA